MTIEGEPHMPAPHKPGAPPDYSIVVPVYYNAGSLRDLEAEIRSKIFPALLPFAGEILFVDDGSKDNSFGVLAELQQAHPSDIRVFKLSRNFGQVNALWCGMTKVKAAAVCISADGQDPVDLIIEMLKQHFNTGTEIVIAKRDSRDDGAWRGLTSKITYWLMKRLSHTDMPVGGFDFYLIGKKAREILIKVYQPHTFLQVRILELGFSRAWIGYHRQERKHGKSRWTFSKKLTYTLDGLLGHSFFAIRFMSYIGAAVSLFGFLLAAFFLINYFVHGHPLQGWTPLMLSVLFIGGLQMIMLGVIGEYIWRILAQVRNSPPYIVETVLDATKPNENA